MLAILDTAAVLHTARDYPWQPWPFPETAHFDRSLVTNRDRQYFPILHLNPLAMHKKWKSRTGIEGFRLDTAALPDLPAPRRHNVPTLRVLHTKLKQFRHINLEMNHNA